MFRKRTKPTQDFGSNRRYFNKRVGKIVKDDNEAENDDSDDDIEIEDQVATETNKSMDEGNTITVDDGDDTGNDNDSDSASDEAKNDDAGSEDGSDEDNESESNESVGIDEKSKDDKDEVEENKIATLSKKQKTSNKQNNNSTKKVARPVRTLTKFQGTAKESTPNKQLEDIKSSTKKRKHTDEDDEDELKNEVTPAKKSHALDNETESLVEKRKGERDARSLFLKNLPPNTTAEILKKLSPEIVNVRIPLEGGKNFQSLYAFIEFENEDAADRNYKKILGKTINNQKFIIDFCGEKSSYKRRAKVEYPVNKRRLFISNMPKEIAVEELKQYIPDAKTFTSKQRGTKRLVFMSFENEEKARKAFEETGELVIRGKKITVLFAYKKRPAKAHAPNRKRKPQIIPVLPMFDDENESKVEVEDSLTESTTETSKAGRKKKQKKKNPISNVETTVKS